MGCGRRRWRKHPHASGNLTAPLSLKRVNESFSLFLEKQNLHHYLVCPHQDPNIKISLGSLIVEAILNSVNNGLINPDGVNLQFST